MWYEELFKELLISKVNKAEQRDSIAFLEIFFQKCRHAAGREYVPPLFILGLIYKIHQKYAAIENNTLTLQQLSRDFVGISIILMKASFENAVWNTDFNLETPMIKSALGLVCTNRTQASVINPLYIDSDVWEDAKFPDTIHQIPNFLDQMRYLEVLALQTLDYDLSIDYDYVLRILIKHRSVIFPGIFEGFEVGIVGKSDDFDELIYKLKLIMIAYQYIEQGNEKGFQALLNGDPYLLSEITLEWELTLGSSQYLTHDLISRNIRYLNTIENRTAFLAEAVKHNHADIANFLQNNTVSVNEDIIKTELESYAAANKINVKTPRVLTISQMKQLLQHCGDLLNRRIVCRVEQFSDRENELWQLLKDINAQLTDEEKTDTQWHKITLTEFFKLCAAHHINILSELDGSVFDASQIDEHNATTPLQSSLLDGLYSVVQQQLSSLTQLCIFSKAKSENKSQTTINTLGF